MPPLADVPPSELRSAAPLRCGGRPSVRRVFTALLFLAASFELGLRWAIPLPELIGFDRATYTHLPPGATAPSFANSTLWFVSEPDGVAGVGDNLNLYGFRGPTWGRAPQPGVQRIAFVGDSFVEGVLSDDEHTIPQGFAHAAQDAGESVEALNWGVAGTDLADYLRLIRDAAPIFRPVAVMLVLFGNDLRLAADLGVDFSAPAAISPRHEWMPRMVEVPQLWAAGQGLPRRWHGAPVAVFRPVPDPLNPWTADGERLASHVAPKIADAMRRGAFNPYITDWVAQVRPFLADRIDPGPHLAALAAYLEPLAVRLYVAYLPWSLQVSDHYLPFARAVSIDADTSLMADEYNQQATEIDRACHALHIPFLDLTPALRRIEAGGTHLYLDYDLHMRPEGYAAVGRELHTWMHAH